MRSLRTLFTLGLIVEGMKSARQPNVEPPAPCKVFSFIPNFSVWADALYWRPLYDGVDYATIIGTPSEVVEVNPQFNWGYRIGVSASLNEEQLYVASEYYHYKEESSSGATAPGAIVPFFQPPLVALADSTSGDLSTKYEAADISIGYRCGAFGCCDSYLFAGARYAHASEDEFFTYNDAGVITPAIQHYDIRGWGPRLGCEFNLHPFSRRFLVGTLGFSGRFAFTALLAKPRLDVNSTTSVFAPEGELIFPPEERIVLGVDFKFEAFYAVCMRAFTLSVRGGYELHAYQDGRERLTSSNQLGTEPRTISALGYGGPFVGLSLSY